MTGARKSTEELTTLYKLIMPILQKSGVEMILFYGSLLGYHRESNFIEGDDDVDVLVSRAQYEKLVDYLKFITRSFITRKMYKSEKLTFNYMYEKHLLQIYHNGIGPFDIFVYESLEDNILIKACQNQIYPKSVIFPTVPVTFNEFVISVPADVEQTILLTYGKDWRIPQVKFVDYNWHEIPEVMFLK
jgi:predicted nucleotidyltransferase